ncbi:hypothetical protein ABW21_db0209738 [Orbilia brochopaga]|nr:hypothetical protein ABW21_db0209738 [Drechslerella brochopaga]
MLAAWYNLRARDPYPDGDGPDHLSGIFSEPENPGLYNEHVDIFKAVNRVFQNGELKLEDGLGKPKIHCGDDWRVLQDPETDQLRDLDGSPMWEDEQKTIPLLIKDELDLYEGLYNSDNTRNGRQIYWVLDENDYLILPEQAACIGTTAAFVTLTFGKMTLCPLAFNPPKEFISHGTFPTADTIASLTPINNYLTFSHTFLHETLHLVLAADKNTHPEHYSVADCLRAARTGGPYEAYGNPQTYVFFCLGATLSRLGRTRANRPVYFDFATGLSTNVIPSQ